MVEAKVIKKSSCVVEPLRLWATRLESSPGRTIIMYPVSDLASMMLTSTWRHGDIGVIVRIKVVTMIAEYYFGGSILRMRKHTKRANWYSWSQTSASKTP